MTRLRVGVIGCGAVAQIMWLPYLRELDDLFELKAICDLSQSLVDALGSYYSVEQRYTDYLDLIKADLDMVIILTPGSHAPPAIAALATGKHVIVEKPMCYTLREADEMIAAAERAGKHLMVAYMKRYDPGYRYGREQVLALDSLRYVQVNVLHPANQLYFAHHRVKRFQDISQTTLERLQAEEDQLIVEAVGPVASWLRRVYAHTLLGSMVHDINALRGILGAPDDVLFTTLWPEGEVPPSVTTVMAYGDAAKAVFTWTYLPQLRDYFEELAFMGQTGRVRIQFPSPFLKHFPTPVEVQGMENGAEWRKRVIVSYAESFKEELLHFYACVIQNQEPLTHSREGRADIALLQRILAVAGPEDLGGEAVQVQ